MSADGIELLVRWTARLAMACYASAPGLRLTRHFTAAQRCYVAGCAICWIHIVCAFHFVHGWSHAAAYEHTARRTADVVVWSWGGGLYFNYLFTLLWTADAAWLLASPTGYARRSSTYERIVQGFLAFMAFNAVVVFGPRPTQWVGAIICVMLTILWYRARSSAATAAPRT